MKQNDTKEIAKLFTAADVETYLKYGWTLLDVITSDKSCPVVYLMEREKKEKQP